MLRKSIKTDESRTVSPALEVKPINANSAEFRQECPEPVLQILNSKAQFPQEEPAEGAILAHHPLSAPFRSNTNAGLSETNGCSGVES
jgi:hypothetical protein